jgi:DNA-binding MarR family transcriptional regulator
MSAPAAVSRSTGDLLLLLRTAGSIESYVDCRLSDIGLSLPKLAALDKLTKAGGSLPLGQLAERLACVKSNVTQLVDRLDVDGLVTRESDPNDRRSRLAVLTDAGRRAYETGAETFREAERYLYSSLTAEETGRLADIFEKLDRAID